MPPHRTFIEAAQPALVACAYTAALIWGVLILAAPAESETVIREEGYGQAGGASYRVDCPAGSYLSGFHGRAGAWIDNMAIACSPWLARERKIGEPEVLADQMIGRSGGGEETSASCPAGWVVSGGYTPRFSDWDDDRVLLHSIEFSCTPMQIEPEQHVPRAFGSDSPLANMDRRWPGHPGTACPAGEFATGIHGRSGLFVDTFGMICREPPTELLCAAGRLVCGKPIKPKKPDPMVQTKKPSDLIRQAP
jgi:hypothetical protein